MRGIIIAMAIMTGALPAAGLAQVPQTAVAETEPKLVDPSQFLCYVELNPAGDGEMKEGFNLARKAARPLVGQRADNRTLQLRAAGE